MCERPIPVEQEPLTLRDELIPNNAHKGIQPEKVEKPKEPEVIEQEEDLGSMLD